MRRLAGAGAHMRVVLMFSSNSWQGKGKRVFFKLLIKSYFMYYSSGDQMIEVYGLICHEVILSQSRHTNYTYVCDPLRLLWAHSAAVLH